MNRSRKHFDYAKVIFLILIIGLLPSLFTSERTHSLFNVEIEKEVDENRNTEHFSSSSTQDEENNEILTLTFEDGNLNITINATTFYPGQNIGINITAINATLNGTFSWHIDSPRDEQIFNSINEGYQQVICKGNLDNDDIEEFVVGSYNGQVIIFNVSNNAINEEASFDIGRNAFGITIGDVHNDSDLDLVVSGDDGQIYIISYDGSVYTINSTIPVPDHKLISQWQKDYWQGDTSLVYHRYGLAVGDVHNDSMPDLVVGDSIGLVYVYTWEKSTQNFVLNWTSTETEDLPLANRMNHDAYSLIVGKIRDPASNINQPEIFVGHNPIGDTERKRTGIHIFRWNSTAHNFNETRLVMHKYESGTNDETIAAPVAKIVSMSIAQATNDTDPDLVVAFASGSSMAILTDKSSTEATTDFVLNGAQIHSIGNRIPLDFRVFDMDNDTVGEILISTSNGINTLYWLDETNNVYEEPHQLMDVSNTLGGIGYGLDVNFTLGINSTIKDYQILLPITNGSLFLLNATITDGDVVLDPIFESIGSPIKTNLFPDPTTKEIQTPLDWSTILNRDTAPPSTSGQFIDANDETGYGPTYYFYEGFNLTIPIFYLRRNGTVDYLWDRTSRSTSGTPTLYSDKTSFKWQVDVLNNTQNDTGSRTYISINGTLPKVPLLLGTYEFYLESLSLTETVKIPFTIDDDIIYNTSDAKLLIKKGLKYSTTVRLQNTTENLNIINTTTYYEPNYLSYTPNVTILSPGDEIVFISSFFFGSNNSVPIDTKFTNVQAAGTYEWVNLNEERVEWFVNGFDEEDSSEFAVHELPNHPLFDDDLSDDNQTHWVYYNDSLPSPNNTDIALNFSIPYRGIYGDVNGTLYLLWGDDASFNSTIAFENFTILYKLLAPPDDPITDPSHYPEDYSLYLGEKTIKNFTLIPTHYYNETIDDTNFVNLNIIEEQNVSLLINRTWGIVNSSLPLRIPTKDIHLNMSCTANGNSVDIFTLWSPLNHTYTYYGYANPNIPTGSYNLIVQWEDVKQTDLNSYILVDETITIIGTFYVPPEKVIVSSSSISFGGVYTANFTIYLNETGEIMRDLDLLGIIDNDPSCGYAIIIDEAGVYFLYVSIDAERFTEGSHNLTVITKTTNIDVLFLRFDVEPLPATDKEEDIPLIAYPLTIIGLVIAGIVWFVGTLRVLAKESKK